MLLFISPPIIRVIMLNAERFQKPFKLLENDIFSVAKDIRQHMTRFMINSMPEPALMALVLTKLHISSISTDATCLMSTLLTVCAFDSKNERFIFWRDAPLFLTLIVRY